MTTEQLNQARADVWHQAGNSLLTADDATAWLRETGVCLFLPRPQLATASPSFVEATLGAANATPAPDAIRNATELLHRLLAAGDAIALNLLALPGEQPDFLATSETLPFLFALRGDKEWKRGPRGKSSPLTIEVWKLLDKEGPLTAEEVKDKLGRQLTEAAALRALTELWSHMRIEPVFSHGAGEDQPAAWQLLERNHQKQMQAGSTMSQAVALSALVSLYLQSAVAASSEEVEVFLSPVASRSKVRDVVKGLTATRQLATLNLGAAELFHVEGSLPEFLEINRVEGAVVEEQGAAETGIGKGRRRFVASRNSAADGVAEQEDRPRSKPAEGARPPRRAAEGGERRSFAARPATARPSTGARPAPGSGRPSRPAAGGERRPYGTRPASGAGSFNPREPWTEDSKPRAPRAESAPGERRPFARGDSPAGGERKSFAPGAQDRPFKPRADSRPGGKPFAPRRDADGPNERRPFAPRENTGGERKSFTPGAGDRPSKPRSDSRSEGRPAGNKPFGERKSFGDRKPFSPRGGSDASERKPFAPRTDGDRPFKPRADARPGGKPSGGKPFGGERKSFGDRKPFSPRSGSEAGERKPFTPRTGDRPFKPRADARPSGKPFGGKPFGGERKSFGDRKPFTPREGGERKPFTPRAGDRPFKARSEGKPYGEKKRFPAGGAAGSADGGRRSFKPREDDAPQGRKPFAPRAGDRPFKPRAGARPFGDRPPQREGSSARPARAAGEAPRKPFSPGRSSTGGRPGASGATPGGPRKTAGAARPRTSPLTSSGKPRSSVKPPAGRPGPRATRGTAAKGPRGGVKRVGRLGKGRSK